MKQSRTLSLSAAGSILTALALMQGTPSLALSGRPVAQAAGAGDAAVPAIDAVALRTAATDPATRAFYDRVGWRPVWSPAARHALEQSLATRNRQGLDHVAFLREPVGAASPAAREVALTGAALRYAAALGHGLVDPASLHPVYTIPRPRPDLAAGLEQALRAGDLGFWLTDLAPQDNDYARLSQVYQDISAAAGTAATPMIAATGTIRPGDHDDRVAAIARQLRDGGYLAPEPPQPDTPVAGTPASDPVSGEAMADAATLYTARLAAAVTQLQRDFGIAADGVVGPDTLAVLNLGPGDRARAIAVAMERRRWLSRTPPATRIDVNTAAAQLSYYRDGVLVDTRKVIVGLPGKETPPLRAPLYRLAANPTWTVPKSIQRSEMAHVGASYLRRHHMVRRNGWIVQLPGPHNSLGLVKFDMRDDQAIYLHDTSAPSLFDRSERHLSHGCVRVKDALGFAQMIAADQGVSAAWQRARASGEHQFVALPRPIPVRLIYDTVLVDETGAVSYRTDPYGWNGPIARALGFADGSAKRAAATKGDIGP